MNEPEEIFAPLSAAEQAAFQAKLWPLLARQASLLTMGESTSLPEEAAESLLASVCYTLGADTPAHIRALMACPDLEAALDAGRARLAAHTRYGKALWQTLCQRLPPVTSEAMLDSLRGIGDFFRLYDIRYAAHCVATPVLIDYPLACPVDEALQGIDYINEWLRRFALESSLLHLYPAAELAALLNVAVPDWKTLPLSLYQPVAEQAIGRVLAGQAPDALAVTPAMRQAIAAKFEVLPRGTALNALETAAAQLCRVPALHSGAQRRYLKAGAHALYPRLAVALPGKNLGGIFFSART
ncbi:MAG: DUF6179 domain-containing protein [Faecalibacterium sp.]|jgi:hypothetical protein|nr:DUF6179 domain-containing protein [Faecalibacterium sp.]